MTNVELGSQVKGMYLNGKSVQGTVYDVSKTTVWIDAEEDMYPCPIGTVQVVEVPAIEVVAVNELEERTSKVNAWMESEGYEVSEFENDEYIEVQASASGRYVVSVRVYMTHYECATWNTEREHARKRRTAGTEEYSGESTSEANGKTFKKLDAVKRYIIKYLTI